ncbi:ferrous iron transport protein B [Parabacteroides distasonis]|uniref:ferrous iron transport protein B n=1 Tax=Parabacteroides distasonis TaxID=823 RepID=UPI0039B55E10
MKLSDLKKDDKGIITKVLGRGAFRKRIIEMGFVQGQEVEVVRSAPLGDPVYYKVMGYNVSLRKSDAELVEVVSMNEYQHEYGTITDMESQVNTLTTLSHEDFIRFAKDRGKTINIALVGNPNCGKTSMFNFASGAHEHVGNYSGVTVDAKEGVFTQDGYTFKIIDLPGTYSLSTYTPEELYVRKYLKENHPDIVVNVIDASNLERNLYLTSQLIDMDTRMVIALNMYDELEKKGDRFDYVSLARMIGAPIIPTIGKTGFGIDSLLKKIIEVYEDKEPLTRHIHINYGNTLETEIDSMHKELEIYGNVAERFSKRFLAIKLLEKDVEIERMVKGWGNYSRLMAVREKAINTIQDLLQTDSETAFTDARYGFISGALRETYHENPMHKKDNTKLIDHIVTSKLLGFPLFVLFLWLMFEATFVIGEYPKGWIASWMSWIGQLIQENFAPGPLADLLTNGIINGVGGVIVFLPQILILYFFISLMEDSGYMARAAFIMDKLMHKMGLHGKSFIPLIMGFGCNVPAVMATRTIESRSSRMITMLAVPLMSCSARLPLYVLICGAFFAEYAGTMLLALYLTGIIAAVCMARLFRKFLFKNEDVPFVMELPPYRMPTTRAICIHMWEKAKQYLHKMGSVILVASVIVWFLGYYPHHSEELDALDKKISRIEQTEKDFSTKEQKIKELTALRNLKQQENSYIGRIGHFISPVMELLGFDWKISVSLLSGMTAKEIVVSSLSVLYADGTDQSGPLAERLKTAADSSGNRIFTPLVALSLLFFMLLYFPCIATVIAISREAHSWKWGLFAVVYTCALAWIVSFAIYQGGNLILDLIS